MRLITHSIAIFISFLFMQNIAYAAQPLQKFNDIIWSTPKGFDLTLDIARPKNTEHKMPVVIIFHGGGWLLNSKSIMSDLAEEIARRANVMTVNVNYRLLSDLNNTTTVDEIIEDAMGAVLWVQDHISEYGGDPERIAVTGDSAGGHLAAMVTLAGTHLSNSGFSQPPLKFKPTYLPKGVSAEEIAKSNRLVVQAAILSYAGFDMFEVAARGFETEKNAFWAYANTKPRGLFGDSITIEQHPEHYKAVSPNHYLIDAATHRLPPIFLHVGENDPVTPAASAQAFTEQLVKLGHNATLKVYKNRAHGYLDSDCNDYNNGCFKELSEPAVTDMVSFIKSVFQASAGTPPKSH